MHIGCASGRQVAATVDDALGALDQTAAKANSKETVFSSRSRFPIVFEKADAVTAAEAALQALLPALRRQLRIPSLTYVHPANQGALYVAASRKALILCVNGDWYHLAAKHLFAVHQSLLKHMASSREVCHIDSKAVPCCQ